MTGDIDDVLFEGALTDAGVELVYKTVRAVLRFHRFPPPGGGDWTADGVDDATHDFVADHLLGKRRLDQIALRATGRESFARLLQATAVNYFRDRARATARGALIRRLGEILDDNDLFTAFRFGSTAHGPDSWWGLSTWDSPQPFAGVPESLVSAASRIPGISVVRWRPDAARRAPVADRESLVRFIVGVLEAAQGLLTVPEIAVVASHRFALRDVPAFEDIDEPSMPHPAAPDVGDVVAAQLKARGILDQLSPREHRLVPLLADITVRELADLLGIGKSTAADARQRVLGIIRAALEPEDDEAAVLWHLEQLASAEHG